MFFLDIGGVASVALAASVLLSMFLERRTPPELRGDWWARFEEELRAYAAGQRRADQWECDEGGPPLGRQ